MGNDAGNNARFPAALERVSGLGDVWQMTPDRNERRTVPGGAAGENDDAIEAEMVLDPRWGAERRGCPCANRRFIGIELDRKVFDMAAAD